MLPLVLRLAAAPPAKARFPNEAHASNACPVHEWAISDRHPVRGRRCEGTGTRIRAMGRAPPPARSRGLRVEDASLDRRRPGLPFRARPDFPGPKALPAALRF